VDVAEAYVGESLEFLKDARLVLKEFDAVIDTRLEAEAAEKKATAKKRKKLFLLFGLAVLGTGAAYETYDWLAYGGTIETDNAYVGADTASITPLVTGSVAQVLVSDAQEVRAGQPLVILDQTDARLAVAEAEAAYDQARRRVVGYQATSRQLSAQIAMRGAETSRAAAEVTSAAAAAERARIDYARRTGGFGLKPLMGGLDPAFAWKGLELFEREVLPKLQADG